MSCKSVPGSISDGNTKMMKHDSSLKINDVWILDTAKLVHGLLYTFRVLLCKNDPCAKSKCVF